MEGLITINLLEDKTVQNKVNRIALISALPLAILVTYLRMNDYISLKDGIFVLIGLFLILPVHELIHGIFFKVFSQEPIKVTYGFKSGFLYASNPGCVYKVHEFIWILIAPLVIITILCLVVGAITSHMLVAILIALLHLNSCSGDLYFVARIIKAKNQFALVGVRDTDTGMDIILK